jgi:uncharacterized protein YkwD
MSPLYLTSKLLFGTLLILGVVAFMPTQMYAAPTADDRFLGYQSSPYPAPTDAAAPLSPGGSFRIYVPLAIGTPQANTSEEQAPANTFATEVLQLTNNLRATNGCGPLTLSTQLTNAALNHSTDMTKMASTISHTGTNGSTFVMRIEQAGYTDFTLAAENIAAGYATPQDVVNGWYNSPGHRANMLNCELKDIGIGYVYDAHSTFNYYWTEDFGTR